MAKRLPEPGDYYRLRFVSTPDYCAAKELFAYVSAYADRENHRYVRQVCVQSVGGEQRVIAAGGCDEFNPRFSPDGNSLLFLSDATGSTQLWVADLGSGAARRLTSMRYGVSSPLWSPKGDKIAFLSPLPPGEDEGLLQVMLTDEEKAALEDERSKQPWVVTDFGYKSEDAMGFARPEGTTHLWVTGLSDEKAVCLTDGDRSHVMPCWSPDGESIIFASSRARTKQEFLGMDLFSVPAEKGEITRLTDSMNVAYYPKPLPPRFTPDGQTIVVGGLVMAGEGLPPMQLFRVPAAGGEAVRIFPDQAPCDGATAFLYNGDGYGDYYEPMQVSSDGRYAYFISGWHGSSNVYRVNIEGAAQVEPLTTGQHYLKSIGAAAGGQMICVRGDMHTPAEVYLLEEKTGCATRLTYSNPWLDEVDIRSMDEMWIKTLDGAAQVQGWVMKPHGAEPGRKYPAVLYIHGGPTPFYGYALSYEHQLMLARGIGLILVNPRGSSSYGARHGQIKYAFDGTAYTDLLQFVDEAVRRYDWIDGGRLGVCGGSYGGYMTTWIAGHSKRFKAAACHRGVANELISYASSDMGGYSSSKSHESYTDFMLDRIKASAVTYSDEIDVPFLILHGMKDMRCPVEHAHQLFTAIKDQHPDLPVRMVLFPKSNHSMTMTGPMYLRLVHYEENIRWFEKHL